MGCYAATMIFGLLFVVVVIGLVAGGAGGAGVALGLFMLAVFIGLCVLSSQHRRPRR